MSLATHRLNTAATLHRFRLSCPVNGGNRTTTPANSSFLDPNFKVLDTYCQPCIVCSHFQGTVVIGGGRGRREIT